MQTLNQYIEAIKKDLTINESNVREASMLAPGKKHFWAARLIHHKINLQKLEKEKTKIRRDLLKKVSDESPIAVSERDVKNLIDNTDIVLDIQDKIDEELLIIQLLEKTEKTMSSMTFDLKNVIEVLKIEQT